MEMINLLNLRRRQSDEIYPCILDIANKTIFRTFISNNNSVCFYKTKYLVESTKKPKLKFLYHLIIQFCFYSNILIFSAFIKFSFYETFIVIIMLLIDHREISVVKSYPFFRMLYKTQNSYMFFILFPSMYIKILSKLIETTKLCHLPSKQFSSNSISWEVKLKQILYQFALANFSVNIFIKQL